MKNRLLFWRIVLFLLAAFTLGYLLETKHITATLYSNWKYVFVLLLFVLILALGLLSLSWTKWQNHLLEWPEKVVEQGKKLRGLAGVLLVILFFFFLASIWYPVTGKLLFPGIWQRLLLFWGIALVGMFCVRILRPDLNWFQALGITSLGMAVFYRVGVLLSPINTYPFTQIWSEASRYYGASLFISDRLYGETLPLPVMHPAWHILLTPPFLFGNMPIWVHRLWNAFLLIGLNFGLGLAIVRHFQIRDRYLFWLATGWAFLFLLQAQILIHLLACALVVVLGTRSNRFWQTTWIVLFTSIWAGLCRINWFPMPALIASTIYLLETPVGKRFKWLSYIWKPAFWFTTGTSIAYAANVLYMKWSGNGDGGNFSSSLTSDLLWYRLFPNPTYPNGVLLELILVTLPLILSIAFSLRKSKGYFHAIRLTGIFAILSVLCAGGILVSTKIGGGSNLHNMDAYLILLMIVGGYFFFELPVPEPGFVSPAFPNTHRYRTILIALAVVIPAWMGLYVNPILPHENPTQAEETLNLLREEAETAARQGGEVLFISQRHLVSLGMVDVPLIPEYELAYLMEMVMSHNRPYLDKFQTDLQEQRFGLIIAEEQNIHFDGRTRPFGEENDLWVQEVSIPLTCYYTPLYDLKEYGFVIFVPKEEPCE